MFSNFPFPVKEKKRKEKKIAISIAYIHAKKVCQLLKSSNKYSPTFYSNYILMQCNSNFHGLGNDTVQMKTNIFLILFLTWTLGVSYNRLTEAVLISVSNLWVCVEMRKSRYTIVNHTFLYKVWFLKILSCWRDSRWLS